MTREPSALATKTPTESETGHWRVSHVLPSSKMGTTVQIATADDGCSLGGYSRQGGWAADDNLRSDAPP